MRTANALIATALLSLTGAGQAQEAVPVAPVQYQCDIDINFLAPTWNGKRPTFFNRTKKGDRPGEWGADEKTDPEHVYGYATVDASGAVLNLHMVWMQSGRMGWPYFTRADLDEITMTLEIGQNVIWYAPSDPTQHVTRFDPDQVLVKIEAQELKKIKQLLVLKVTQPGFGPDRASLGGLADIPAWRKSASITVRWPELAAVAKADKLLDFNLSVPRLGQYGIVYDHVRSGHLDLTPIPTVMEQFRSAETKLHELARDPAKNCRKLEPPVAEDNPLAEI